MKKILFLNSFLLVLFLNSCDNKHFITDRTYRNKVKNQFEVTRKLAANREDQLFGVFDQKLSLQEKEALQFLFAYMPLSDLADYNGDFYLQNVRASFAARDTFSWGKHIPEDIFRHFVLPVRVNNENLDSARIEFFAELKDRIKTMTLKEAILEVNHWCHEKVTYKGTDSRTSSPLATIKTAYGRCGEESTFTVSAMRAACIPARQCYTPRWAHSDDNHAWVEVWVDGKWHYLGACEPEPDLDLGWFSGPSKRTMLVNTNVFGDYTGAEDVLLKDPRFTRINILPNYTKTKRIFVKVTGEDKKPADSAIVEFQLYNYAEFYPLTRTFTGKDGLCSFLTGYGDLIIWSAKGDRFAYRKITVKDMDTLHLVLSLKPGREYAEDIDLVPPPEVKAESKVSDSARAENTRRFTFEDQIRGNYEKTFIDSTKSRRLAEVLKVNPDSLWNFLKGSRGNYREIIDFISSVPEEKKGWIFPLLGAISEKDLHDIPPGVLFDAINAIPAVVPSDYDRMIYTSYVLNPRVDNELLKPYKSVIRDAFDQSFIDKCRKVPLELVSWIRQNLKIDAKANYAKVPITPCGVYELKVADEHSRDIFFVAACRSFGIGSRLEPSTLLPQYYHQGKWIDIRFDPEEIQPGSRAILIIDKDPQKKETVPEYYSHFTIERFSDGFYKSLNYENDSSLKTLPCRLEVMPGAYMMVTGHRIEGGTVLSRLTFFNLESGKEKRMQIILREKPILSSVPDIVVNPSDLILKITGKPVLPGKSGTIIAWLEPEKEPSRHFIADLILKKNDFSKWNGRILLLFKTEREKKLFVEKNTGEIPKTCSAMVIPDGSLPVFMKMMKYQTSIELPVVTYVDQSGKIRYFSSGYRIGTGDELLQLTR